MVQNLSDALQAAKTDRKVLSKHIIWESGVSKSQFYRIIKGEESPSAETKQKISEALRIDTERFDALFAGSKPNDETSDNFPDRLNKWRRPILALSVVIVGAGLLMAFGSGDRGGVAETRVITEHEDSTLFIEDVTIPDGTSIPINTKFVKTWRVKNSGKLVWKDRYLQRMTPASSLLCASPSRVPIPETQPGETIDISVTFTTPYLPGSCRTDWKTTDKDGNVYFPDMHGLYSIVVVTAE